MNSTHFLPSLSQLNSVSKKVSVVDEDDHMEEDWDVTRTQQGDDIDLFEEGDESDREEEAENREKLSQVIYRGGNIAFFFKHRS